MNPLTELSIAHPTHEQMEAQANLLRTQLASTLTELHSRISHPLTLAKGRGHHSLALVVGGTLLGLLGGILIGRRESRPKGFFNKLRHALK